MIRGLMRFLIDFLFGRNTSSRAGTSLAIFLSFLLAVGMWVVVTLDNEYTTSLPIPFLAVVSDFDLQLAKKPPTTFDTEVTAKGSDLALYLFFQPGDTFYWQSETRPGTINLDSKDLNQEMTRILGNKFRVNRVKPESLSLSFEQKVSRKVPLVWAGQLHFEPSYRLTGELYLSTDSVSLHGPRDRIDQIDYWYTQDTIFNILPGMASVTLHLVDTISDISVRPKIVTATFVQKKHTETRLTLPLVATHVPSGIKVRFIPDSITFTCLVPMDQFDEIRKQAKAWQVQVSYNSLDPRNPSFIPDFPKYRPEVQLLRRDPLEVQFIVIEKAPPQ